MNLIKAKTTACTAGFSLIEVVLALSVVSFCLVALVGLLPVGLQTFKNSKDESLAANLFAQVSSGVRNATKGSADDYVAKGPDFGLAWGLGGPEVVTSVMLNADGGQSTENDAKFAVRVEVSPPVSKHVTGRALISIAWPASAEWNTTKQSWDNAQGSTSGAIVFLPKP